MTEPTPTIYSFYTAEVEQIVQYALTNLNSPRQPGNIHQTLTENLSPGLDDLHFPLLFKYEAFARNEGVIGLDAFEEKYFTNGSSEGIFHLIAGLLPGERLYQFDGEYQGYKSYADSIGRKIITVFGGVDEMMEQEPGIIIMSAPASRDGNRVDPAVIKRLGTRHRLILDLAYMGMTQEPLNLDLTEDYVVAVLGSLSKPFGMYYFRTGFLYSRYPIASLYANKWFKNALSIKLAEAVLDHFDPRTLTQFKEKYRGWQLDSMDQAECFLGLGLQASDVWLLAHTGPISTESKKLSAFKRGDENPILRVCLTPYYMESR